MFAQFGNRRYEEQEIYKTLEVKPEKLAMDKHIYVVLDLFCT